VLAFEDARGSITRGGTIGSLHWERPGIALTIEALELDWSLRELAGRDLAVRTLRAGSVLVRLTPAPPPPPQQPFVMPAQLTLPLKLDVPLAVGSLRIESVDEDGVAGSQLIEDIRARYVYDGEQHAFDLQSLRYGQSSAQAELRL